jgi:hypothetical protein
MDGRITKMPGRSVLALLYEIAEARRQPWVSSRLLGSTGIGLILPEKGHSHQSVGGEAREGAIS